jgi:hypothetical protein
VRDGGELVLHTVDANRHDGGAGQGTKEDPPEGVAHRNSEAGLQRLGYYAGVVVVTLHNLYLGNG